MPLDYVAGILNKESIQTFILTFNNDDDTSDENHTDLNIIGVLSYSLSACRIFSELVFIVIKTEYQTNGYGNYLINSYFDKLKKMNVPFGLTWADNNALNFFSRQEYCPVSFLTPALYSEEIGDYDGATLFEKDLRSYKDKRKNIQYYINKQKNMRHAVGDNFQALYISAETSDIDDSDVIKKEKTNRIYGSLITCTKNRVVIRKFKLKSQADLFRLKKKYPKTCLSDEDIVREYIDTYRRRGRDDDYILSHITDQFDMSRRKLSSIIHNHISSDLIFYKTPPIDYWIITPCCEPDFPEWFFRVFQYQYNGEQNMWVGYDLMQDPDQYICRRPNLKGWFYVDYKMIRGKPKKTEWAMSSNTGIYGEPFDMEVYYKLKEYPSRNFVCKIPPHVLKLIYEKNYTEFNYCLF